jgi:O-antigen ligase
LSAGAGSVEEAPAITAPVAPRAAVPWLPLAILAPVVIGATTTVSPVGAIALALVVALLAALLLKPGVILHVLIASIFMELLNLGGVTISRLLAPVALLVLALASVRPGTEIRPAPPLFWAFAYSAWALASGFWTESLPGTLYLLASLAIALVYMLCFASLLRTRQELDRLLLTLAAVSFLIGTLSIFAFIGRPILGFGLLQEGRVQGGTGDPSFFAAAQLIALPLLLVLAGETKVRRNLIYVAALTNIASVLTTVSRGGVLQLIVIAIIVLIIPARSIFSSPRHKTVVMIVMIAGATLFFVRYSADLAPRLKTIFVNTQEQTGSGRVEFWAAARQSVSERPVLGVGYGAWVRISNERLLDTPNVKLGNFKLRPAGSEVHNAFLGTLTEVGLVGLALFLGLLGSTALALRRFARQARQAGAYYYEKVANALVIGLIGWCVGSVFIETETSRPIWILIGICLALPKLLDEHRARTAAIPVS